MSKIKLLDLLLQEYFAIVEHLQKNRNEKGDKIIIESDLFYSFLDKNLYIKRNEKLKAYKQLNLIVCNSKGYTSVLYDKESKKSKRKVIINLESYYLIRKFYGIEIGGI